MAEQDKDVEMQCIRESSASPAHPLAALFQDEAFSAGLRASLDEMLRYGRATGLQVAVSVLREAGAHPAFHDVAAPDFARMVADVIEQKISPADLNPISGTQRSELSPQEAQRTTCAHPSVEEPGDG